MVERQYPFHPYPIGWFQVAYGDEVKQGDVLPLRYFGKDLVLFRGDDGKANVLDAFCPHLGAHMGHGGRVEGKCLRCPFHDWAFDGEGKCTDVPYAKKIPPKASLKSWTVVEKNNQIMVWQHPHGEAPTFELPALDEVDDDQWSDDTRRSWKIKTRNQEMAENAVDSAHFHYVHGASNMPEAAGTFDGHIMRVVSGTGMETPRGGVDGQVESVSYGFGFAYIRFTGIVETLLINSVTPIDEDHVDVRFSFRVKKLHDADITKGVGKAFVAEVSRQLEEDIPIWENKKYVDPPMLCDGDGPIGLFRKWSRQFYVDDHAEPSGKVKRIHAA
jgi:nitrite reductase/ring-hydroxylating ferredoxin subunit